MTAAEAAEGTCAAFERAPSDAMPVAKGRACRCLLARPACDAGQPGGLELRAEDEEGLHHISLEP